MGVYCPFCKIYGHIEFILYWNESQYYPGKGRGVLSGQLWKTVTSNFTKFSRYACEAGHSVRANHKQPAHPLMRPLMDIVEPCLGHFSNIAIYCFLSMK